MSDMLLCIVSGREWLKAMYAMTEARIVDALSQYGAGALRIAIGAVFVWFGLLKIAGKSPAAPLVLQTLQAMDVSGAMMVTVLGVVETIIGVALCFGIAPRSTLLLFLLQQAGTWLVLVLCPDLAFQQHHPWLLTMTGEFVVKNLVLMVGGIVSLGERLRRVSDRTGGSRGRERAWALADAHRFDLRTTRAI